METIFACSDHQKKSRCPPCKWSRFLQTAGDSKKQPGRVGKRPEVPLGLGGDKSELEGQVLLLCLDTGLLVTVWQGINNVE